MNHSSRKTSSSKNPMELLERYLQAVRFWVPNSQKDLIAELAEDLRSQLDEKAAELGRPLDEEEVSTILRRCGSPMVVAGRLGPKRYLIGPALYPIYIFVLKMVLVWILVPVFLFIVGPTNLASSNGNWGMAALNTFGDLWSGLFIAAGIITVVFAIVERTAAVGTASGQLGSGDKWDPRSLPPLHKEERKTSLAHTTSELIFGCFGLIWLLLLPRYPVLILGPAAAFLKAAPMWHTFYVPVLLLGVAGLLRSSVTLARPQWGWFPLTAQLMQTIFTLLVMHFMINAAGQTANGEWHPFLMLAETARNSAQYIKVVAVVNVSIMISLAGAWIGLCIAGVVQTWQLLRYLRKRSAGARQPVSMQAL